jgi:serine/threonine protein phosphatase 1
LICLKGNHEGIMWRTRRRKVPPHGGWWLDNSGGATLISYGQNEGDKTDVTVVLEEHLEWIERLPLMHIDKYCPSPACPLAATL